jgi:hypothetical protein
MSELVTAIAHVNSGWSIAAFAIAAVLGVLNRLLGAPDAAKRRGRRPPAILTNGLVWPLVAAICFLGALPIVANTYIESLRVRGADFYRIRVVVLGADGNPVSGAVLRTTASNETTSTSQGTAVVTVARGAVPQDGNVTIFADLDAAFLHGRADVRLQSDLNPAVTIHAASPRDATVTGMVQDDTGRAVAGASVMVVGGESGTTLPTGSFTLKAGAAAGQIVRVHAEKDGYAAVDQDHPAGREPVTIVLARSARGR